MKKIILGVLLGLLVVGCSSKTEETKDVEAKLQAGKSLSSLLLKDQFEKEHAIKAETTQLIFALSKESAHICNDFFVTQIPTYLDDHKTQFIADVSAAPSLIRSMFIMPGLKDFKHTVLILDDKAIAAPFRSGVDVEKIILVKLSDGEITSVETLESPLELQKAIEAN